MKAFELKFKTWNGVRFQNPIRGNRIGAVVVRASSDIDGTTPTETREAEKHVDLIFTSKEFGGIESYVPVLLQGLQVSTERLTQLA